MTLDRMHLERVLRINGLSATAADEEIRSVLLSARYREEEITAALSVLKGGATVATAGASDATNKLFRSDETLNSQDISRLLGIEVNVSQHQPAANKSSSQSAQTLFGQLLIISGAIVLGLVGTVVAMYVLKFGIFHPTAALLIFTDF